MCKRFFVLVLAGMISTVIQATETPFNPEIFDQTPQNETCKPPQWRNFLQKYGTSCSVGIIVGAGTGTGSHLLDDHIPFRIINFLIWMGIRQKGVEIISSDLDKYAIEHDKTIIQNVAWISDWVTYLTLTGYLAS